MKYRYYIFCYHTPAGGMNDCAGKANTLDEAKAVWENSLIYEFCGYGGQILDAVTGEITKLDHPSEDDEVT